nr:NUDIX domain-containing protein [Methylomonas koyamae]
MAQRAQHAHQGGLWEFPGGKLEPGEPVLQLWPGNCGKRSGFGWPRPSH